MPPELVVVVVVGVGVGTTASVVTAGWAEMSAAEGTATLLPSAVLAWTGDVMRIRDIRGFDDTGTGVPWGHQGTSSMHMRHSTFQLPSQQGWLHCCNPRGTSVSPKQGQAEMAKTEMYLGNVGRETSSTIS